MLVVFLSVFLFLFFHIKWYIMSGNDVIVVVSNGTLHSGTCIKW